MTRRILVKRDTTSNWTANNPVLLNAELGLDTTLDQLKIGDGSTAWNSLPFITVADVSTLSTVGHTHSGYQTALDSSSVVSVSNLICTSASVDTNLNWNVAYGHKTVSEDVTFTFSNAVNGKSISFAVTGDGTDRTLTWPAGVKWAGTSHTTVKAGKINVYTFLQLNGVIFGSVVSDMS